MELFEYKVVQVGGDRHSAEIDITPWANFESFANIWGSEGWELVSMGSAPDGNTMAVFKRPLQPGRGGLKSRG